MQENNKALSSVKVVNVFSPRTSKSSIDPITEQVEDAPSQMDRDQQTLQVLSHQLKATKKVDVSA